MVFNCGWLVFGILVVVGLRFVGWLGLRCVDCMGFGFSLLVCCLAVVIPCYFWVVVFYVVLRILVIVFGLLLWGLLLWC